jgi:hypothetical protein
MSREWWRFKLIKTSAQDAIDQLFEGLAPLVFQAFETNGHIIVKCQSGAHASQYTPQRIPDKHKLSVAVLGGSVGPDLS